MGSMNLDLPTEDGDDDVWDTLINAALTVIEEHDHSSGNGTQVPSAGLDIDADLSFGGHAITSLKALSFSGVTSYSVAKSFFVDSDDNELYYRTNGGVNIKVTNGATLNLSLVGGITGDYSTTDADVEYVDSEKAFEFKQDESPDYWAKLKVGDIKLHQTSSGVTNAVTLKSPAALAASYDMTMPAAVPASTSVLLMASTGALSSTRDPSVDTVTATTVTGTNVATLASGVKHADRTMILPMTYVPGGTFTVNSGIGDTYYTNATNTIAMTIPVPVGSRIKSVSAHVLDNAATAATLFVYSHPIGSGATPGTVTTIGSAATPGNAATIQVVTVGSLTTTVAANTQYTAEVTLGNAGHRLYMVTVTFDRVA